MCSTSILCATTKKKKKKHNANHYDAMHRESLGKTTRQYQLIIGSTAVNGASNDLYFFRDYFRSPQIMPPLLNLLHIALFLALPSSRIHRKTMHIVCACGDTYVPSLCIIAFWRWNVASGKWMATSLSLTFDRSLPCTYSVQCTSYATDLELLFRNWVKLVVIRRHKYWIFLGQKFYRGTWCVIGHWPFYC